MDSGHTPSEVQPFSDVLRIPFRVESAAIGGIFVGMEERKKLDFAVFLVHALAEAWKVLPREAYRTLDDCGALDGYVWPCYDVLHTMGRQALVDDLTDYARGKGFAV